MNNPLVTIITPAYNCARYIADTIESVLGNGYENIQYLILDDCSTDGTWELITDIYKNNVPHWEKLGFSHHRVNAGEQKTVNEALQYTSGKYFMIVNADDPLMPGAVAVLAAFMECHPEVLCAYPHWHSIDEDGKLKTRVTSREYDFAYMVKHHTCLPSVGSIFRSSIIKSIGLRDTSYRWLGDFDYWLRIGLAGEMARVPMTLAYWRHRDGQASGDKSDARAQEHIRIIRELYLRHDIPFSILAVKREAVCWSNLVAAAVTDSKWKWLCYIARAFISHPLIMFNIEFVDTVRKRAIHILRR